MIGSFWNLCRACPSMPVDKLHSEYRSTYRWHEYTGGSRPEVIRKPPIANQFASSTDHFFSKSADEERHVEGTINEPPLPRRKKCPELAYKTHEFISCDQQQQQQPLKNEFNSANRARSEERTGTPSRRSKSEGPPRIPNGNAYAFRDAIDPVTGEKTEHAGRQAAGESSGLFKKTITKLSTEYRLQFVWPHTRKDTNQNQCTDDAVDFPKKSLSMGAIKATQSNAMPTVHKKRTTHEKEATVQELEPLFNNADEKKEPRSRSNIRPFSQYGINEGKHRQNTTEKENFGFCDEKIDKIDNKTLTNGIDSKNVSWYKDVIELRKKAGEYKHRGWGVEIQPDLYNKQKELWDQVSRRSSLSALSLASTVHKPISKEEKEKENNKKTSPSKGYGRYQNIRHHLERTTGADVEEGALLPSPTREKLLPTIPKSKDDESYNSQRGSPKKGSTSKHGSPQKSPKKILKQGARSQSVGPTVPGAVAAAAATTTTTDGSPKRRTGSSATTAAGTPSSVSNTAIIKTHKKTPASTPTMAERRPRPTTLSTSTHSRSKSSTLPSSSSGKSHYSGPGNHQQIQSLQNNDNNNPMKKISPATLTIPNLKKAYKTTNKPHHQRPKSMIVNGQNDPMTESTINFDQLRKVKGQQKKTAENEDDTYKDGGGGVGGGGGTSISSASPIPMPHEITEHIVKSPPEPTRVKSPEQILMRSPDPVNWTVPLDTGKTFTVTQNVRDGILGESIMRPQSEFKVSTSCEKPPPAPQSAPPELAEQANMEAWKNEQEPQENLDIKNQLSAGITSTIDHPITTATVSEPTTTNTTSTVAATAVPEVRFDKPVPGTTLRCLDDPNFDPEINSPGSVGNRTISSDVLEKARDRFDRFWGGNKEENV